MPSDFMTGFGTALTQSLDRFYAQQEQRSRQEEQLRKGVFQALLQSQDPEVQALALSGMMEKGKRGFFGELKASPTQAKLAELIKRVQGAEVEVPGTLGTPRQVSLEGPPPAPPGALPATSPTQGGPGPMESLMGPIAALAGGGGGAGAGGAMTPPSPSPRPPAVSAEEAAPRRIPVSQAAPAQIAGPEDAIALIRSRDPLGLDPFYGKMRSLIELGQAQGMKWPQIKEMIGGLRAELMPTAARTETQAEVAQLRTETQRELQELRGKKAEEKEERGRAEWDRRREIIDATAEERQTRAFAHGFAMIAAAGRASEQRQDRSYVASIQKKMADDMKLYAGAEGALDAMEAALDEYIASRSSGKVGEAVERGKRYMDQSNTFNRSLGRTYGESRFTDEDQKNFRELVNPRFAFSGDVLVADPSVIKRRLATVRQDVAKIRDSKLLSYEDSLTRLPSGAAPSAGAPPPPAPAAPAAAGGRDPCAGQPSGTVRRNRATGETRVCP